MPGSGVYLLALVSTPHLCNFSIMVQHANFVGYKILTSLQTLQNASLYAVPAADQTADLALLAQLTAQGAAHSSFMVKHAPSPFTFLSHLVLPVTYMLLSSCSCYVHLHHVCKDDAPFMHGQASC